MSDNSDNISDHDSSYETVSVHTDVASLSSSDGLARESTIVENNDVSMKNKIEKCVLFNIVILILI